MSENIRYDADIAPVAARAPDWLASGQTVPYGATLHHSCAFTLAHRAGGYLKWRFVADRIREWALLRLPERNTLAAAWFLTGGNWVSRESSRTSVRTARFVGNGKVTAPQYWAFQIDSPCSATAFRNWRTEIGLTLLGPDRIIVSSRTYHWLQPGYLGLEPEAPVPTAPSVVQGLTAMRQVAALAGTEELSKRPIEIEVGHGRELVDSMQNAGRLCPVVYVSAATDAKRHRLDPVDLASVLSGAAKVFFAADARVDEELSYLIPDDFRCQTGTVRVYQPGLNFDAAGDWRRHRFFSRSRIDELGAISVRDILVRSICRRNPTLPKGAVASIHDVYTRERESTLRELRSRRADVPEKEWVDLILETNDKLEKDFRTLKEDLDRAILDNAKLQDDLDEVRSERDSKAGAAKFAQSQLDDARAAVAALERQAVAVEGLSSLPETLVDVMNTVAGLWPHRVAIADSAAKSAVDASYNDPAEAWRCLWTIPTLLWTLVFEEVRADWMDEYSRRTPFSLAMTETKQTKSDKSIMKSRKVTFGGQEIDITPHIKIGVKEPKCLRVHFWIDRPQRRIVIGHCGDHMDTAGTRRL